MTDEKLKRFFDLFVSIPLFLLFFPVVATFCILIYLDDRKHPLYLSQRVAKNNRNFIMFKLRSMTVSSGPVTSNSTSYDDPRVTSIGRIVRLSKIDELLQLLNVIRGDMSLVGPRPNTRSWGVDLYSAEELAILSVRPGITDLASIVFSDEATILLNSEHPDLLYNQLIRPLKSRLCLWYVRNNNLLIDLKILFITFVSFFNRDFALSSISRLIRVTSKDSYLASRCLRQTRLVPEIPPGLNRIEDGSYYEDR